MKFPFFLSIALVIIVIGAIPQSNMRTNSVQSSFNSDRIENVNLKFNQDIVGDLISYHMDAVKINIGDTILDEKWDDVPEYTVKEYSDLTHQGSIKSVHDDFYIYALITFPSSTSWIAIEFNATDSSETSMDPNDDGWVFGSGTVIPNGALDLNKYIGDVHYIGNGQHPVQDERNDLTYEIISNEETELTSIEIRRPLNTNDPSGNDIVLTEGSIFNVKFASNLNQQTHKNGGTPYLMNITPEMIAGLPEPTNQTSVVVNTPEDIRNNNEFLLFALTSFGLIVNFILLTLILVFYGKK